MFGLFFPPGKVVAETYMVSLGVPMRTPRLPDRATTDGTPEPLGYKVSIPEGDVEAPATTYPRTQAKMW